MPDSVKQAKSRREKRPHEEDTQAPSPPTPAPPPCKQVQPPDDAVQRPTSPTQPQPSDAPPEDNPCPPPRGVFQWLARPQTVRDALNLGVAQVSKAMLASKPLPVTLAAPFPRHHAGHSDFSEDVRVMTLPDRRPRSRSVHANVLRSLRPHGSCVTSWRAGTGRCTRGAPATGRKSYATLAPPVRLLRVRPGARLSSRCGLPLVLRTCAARLGGARRARARAGPGLVSGGRRPFDRAARRDWG
jgi:hypothetical protein